MISGTSFDAVEAVAADIDSEGTQLSVDLLGHASVSYPPELRSTIAGLLPPAPTTGEILCRLDTAIGRFFAAVAAEMIRDHCDGRVDVICSHGQTVYHWVENGRARGTLQLGQAAWIAERTGALVVSDLRSRDIAAGGQGAPLVSLLDILLVGPHPSRITALLNLGGIANVTVVSPTAGPVAFDIGPANALIDAAVGWVSQGREDHDHDGRRARRGAVDHHLLMALLDDPYYAAPPPKSTGKEHFHLAYLRERIGSGPVAGDDLVATVTELTSRVVADSLRQLHAQEVVASGGGTRNPALMASLAHHLGAARLRPIGDFGVLEGAKEALAFALIGFLTVNGLPGTVPACTGADRAVVLGSITPGVEPLALPAGVMSPSRLWIRTPLPNVPRSSR